MSHTSTTATAAAPRRSNAQWAIVAVLVILGILALIAAILFITGAANSIHFLSGSVHHGHHQIRLTVSIVAAVLLLAAAGYFMRTTSKSLACTAAPVDFRLIHPPSHDFHCPGPLTFPSPGPRNREISRVVARERR